MEGLSAKGEIPRLSSRRRPSADGLWRAGGMTVSACHVERSRDISAWVATCPPKTRSLDKLGMTNVEAPAVVRRLTDYGGQAE